MGAGTALRPRRPQLRLSERKLLLAFGDMIAVSAAILLSLYIWSLVAGEPYTAQFVASQAVWFIVLPLIWFPLASAADFFDLRVAASRSRTLGRLLAIEVQLVVIYLLVFFLSPRDALPRLFIFYYAVSSFLFIAIWRFAGFAVLGWASAPRRLLVVGAGWSAEALISAINSLAAHEYEVRGVIGTADDLGRRVSGVPVVSAGEDLMRVVERDEISEVVTTATTGVDGATFQGLMDVYEHGVRVVPMAILYEQITGRVPVEHVNNDWAVVFLPVSRNEGVLNVYLPVKRLLDILLSLAGLAAFALLIPALAIAIRVNSPGGIFYRQERLGKSGQPFFILKLRTMVDNAEQQTGAVFAQKGDPRVTRTGRFLRKTRLDELPQLVNVLRGEMSLVGPRPERPEHVARLQQKIPFYRTRLAVRPGLTGWAQVRYSYGSDDNDALVKLQYDLYYIRHSSLLLDLNILLRTVGKVLSLSGV
ncbi:MAG: sugar transferase [Anaerolineae bacterium]|nr:sugar transferase [Anaerolineae bacterium]